MNEHASYIGDHERCLQELIEEGFPLPAEAAVLAFRDPRRDREVTLLFPSRGAAEGRARRAPGGKTASRVRVYTLEEAVA